MARSAAQPASRLDDRATAQRLIKAAAELFARQGYAKTSIQDVADEVGVLKGSLYYYIDTKEDLLFRILDDTRRETIQIVEDISELTDLSPLDRLRAYVKRHIEYNATHVTNITVYYHDFDSLSPELRKVVGRQNKRYEEFVEGLLEEAKEAGEIDAGLDIRLLTKSIFATINYLYTWYRPRGRVKPVAVADQFAEFVIAGVANSKASPAA